ncbi:MAG TPA: nuclear transport factor 2 family protein [Solirubrobacteraceae bacterium]
MKRTPGERASRRRSGSIEGSSPRPSEFTKRTGCGSIGHDEILAAFAARAAMTGRRSLHACTGCVIDVVRDDRATGIVNLQLYRADEVPPRGRPPATAPILLGRYEDEFALTSDGWRFAARRLVTAFGDWR